MKELLHSIISCYLSALWRARSAFDFARLDKARAGSPVEAKTSRGELESALRVNLEQEKIGTLSAWLKRHPFWLNGHNEFAEVALNLGDARKAYLAAQCALALEATNLRAKRCLAKSYLQAGSFTQAKASFARLLNTTSNSRQGARDREDYVASLIGLEEFELAHEEIKKVPSSELSFEGQAALRYIEQRLTNPEGFSGTKGSSKE